MKPFEWHPISDFDFAAAYADASFLVWLSPPPGHEMADHFQECWIEDGKFMGTWRHMGSILVDLPFDHVPSPSAINGDEQSLGIINALEPVAFMLVDAPAFLAAQADPAPVSPMKAIADDIRDGTFVGKSPDKSVS